MQRHFIKPRKDIPGYPGARVTHVSIDQGYDGQDAAHLGVGVAGHHLEYVVVEIIKERVELLLADLPQLRVDVHVEVLGGLVTNPLISALQISGELCHQLLLLLGLV